MPKNVERDDTGARPRVTVTDPARVARDRARGQGATQADKLDAILATQEEILAELRGRP